jgi:hypothetical protein
MPNIALVSGFWGQNIGNAFFNIGGKYILDQVFGAENVRFIQDQPAYRTFHDQSKGNPRNDFNLLRYLDVDVVVLQGPALTVNFRHIWADAFEQYRRRNIKVILLGAGLFKFTEKEIRAAREFLQEYPPLVISTRDHDTYEVIKSWSPHTYSGIDSAFFVPDVYTPIPLAIEPYIVLNFDRFPEPTITQGTASSADGRRIRNVEWEGHQWTLTTPRIQQWFSGKGKWQAYIGHWLDRRKLPAELCGFKVVRPEHRFNPHVAWKIYRQANAIASDEPFTYFTVYGNTSLTLADRVHACVITLAYGKPAMLFTPSPRARLFDRLGLAAIRDKPVTLCPQRLCDEKNGVIEFLRKAVQSSID